MKYNVELRPMDTVAARPRDWLGRAITFFSPGEFSHVGKILKFGGRTWVVDADPPVVRIMPLSSWLKKYKSVAVFRLDALEQSPESWRTIERQAEKFLFPMIGVREYSKGTIARLAARLPFGWVPDDEEPNHTEPVICSRLVSEADIFVADVDPVDGVACWASTPNDITGSPEYNAITPDLEVLRCCRN